MNFAFEVINTVRAEEPQLFDNDLGERITAMLEEAVDAEFQFAEDLLGEGVPGMSTADTRTYLEFVADQRLSQLGLPKRFNASNPFAFMELQDVQELSNFFERTVSAYQVGVEGDVAFDEDFEPTLSPPRVTTNNVARHQAGAPQTAASLTNGAAVPPELTRTWQPPPRRTRPHVDMSAHRTVGVSS